MSHVETTLIHLGWQFASLQNLWHPLGNGDSNVPNRTKIQVQDAILLLDDTSPLRKILPGHSAQSWDNLDELELL
jgi:hypothetical protein